VVALTGAVLASSPLSAQHKDCAETRHPKQLPAVSTIVDSAAALAHLLELDSLRGDMRFSLLFDEVDSLPFIRPLDDANPRAGMTLLHWVVPEKPTETWAVRVHVVGGASPSLTIERSIFCPPRPLNASSSFTGIEFRLFAGDTLPGSESRNVRVRFEALISEDGVPLNVRLLQSSGREDLDNEIRRQLAGVLFHPALLDSIPIQALYRTDGHSPRM